MHYLRHAPLLARLVLACFALTLGLASATPLLRAPAMERLCSAAGEARWQLVPDAPGTPTNVHTLDCALCLPLLAAPPASFALPDTAPPIADIPVLAPAPAHWMQRTRAPFPPRAPPATA